MSQGDVVESAREAATRAVSLSVQLLSSRI